MELQNTVKEALTALYHHPDDAVRAQADRWLQDFLHTIDAWQVSDNLLHDASSNIETLIFCSQTLRSKVQCDYEELPSEAFRPLRDSLYALLKKFSEGPPKVRTQISSAIAALAVHVPVEDWGDGGIVNWISNEMRAHSGYIPGLLELLTVLPEEAHSYRIAARPERRRHFEKELASSAETAFGLLMACLNFGELEEQVLEAFASWLRLNSGISPSTLASHPLVQTALSYLTSEQYLEAAVNVVSELIHYASVDDSDDFSVQMPLIHVLVPRIMALKGQLKDSSKEEEDIKAIARLFADMGDSFVELIASGSEESMLIVHALLEVASHPDYDISSMTYNFWHHLQLNLTQRESFSSYESDALLAEEMKRRLHLFHLPFQMLVSLVNFRVEYPQDYENLSEEDHKDFKQIRYAVGDVLVDAAKVLGGEATLKILFSKLVEAVGSCSNDGNYKWQPVEAALYCIQAISKSISPEEVEIVPQVMVLLPKLPHQSQLLQTVCATIGSYSKWIKSAGAEQPILPSLVYILTKGMSTSEDTAASATLAFKHICEDCRKQFSESLDGLFHIYHIAISGEGGYKVSVDDSMYLVEALSVVITELSTEHAKKALELLCLPAISSLQKMIFQGDAAFQQIPARQLTLHIDRIACIFRNVNLPEVVADAVQRLWPLFRTIFDQRAWDMRTMESLCRSCKYAVRTCGNFMGITIGAMLETVQSLYQQHNQACFLYLSSEVIKIFGSDPSCASYLQGLIEILFSHTTRLLLSLQDFTARPDIADDCYLLASRCIRYCPDLFLPSSVLPSLVDCAMIGITIQQREACRSILNFLGDVFDIGKLSNKKYASIRDSIVLPRGSSLTRVLIASVAGALPSSRIEEVSYVLLFLLRAYGTRAVEWATAVIQLIPSAALTEAECNRFLKSAADAASSSDSSSFFRMLEDVSDVCRRNKAVQEMVMGALRPTDLHLPAVS